MKKAYLLLVLLIFNFFSQAQEEITCNLLPRISTNSSSKFNLSEVTRQTYNASKTATNNPLVLFTNSDSIESILKSNYPKLFTKKNGKYEFKGLDDQDIIVLNNLAQDKTYSKYSFKAQFKNYIIIFQEYYEGASSILVDIETNRAYSLPNKPYFISDNLVYSYGAYPTGTYLKILDIGKNEYISLDFDNVIFKNSYYISNHMLFEVKCLESDQTKYLEVLKY